MLHPLPGKVKGRMAEKRSGPERTQSDSGPGAGIEVLSITAPGIPPLVRAAYAGRAELNIRHGDAWRRPRRFKQPFVTGWPATPSSDYA
jgi:hypothetical protein